MLHLALPTPGAEGHAGRIPVTPRTVRRAGGVLLPVPLTLSCGFRPCRGSNDAAASVRMVRSAFRTANPRATGRRSRTILRRLLAALAALALATQSVGATPDRCAAAESHGGAQSAGHPAQAPAHISVHPGGHGDGDGDATPFESRPCETRHTGDNCRSCTCIGLPLLALPGSSGPAVVFDLASAPLAPVVLGAAPDSPPPRP